MDRTCISCIRKCDSAAYVKLIRQSYIVKKWKTFVCVIASVKYAHIVRWKPSYMCYIHVIFYIIWYIILYISKRRRHRMPKYPPRFRGISANFLSSRSVLEIFLSRIFPSKNEAFRLVSAILVNWHFSREYLELFLMENFLLEKFFLFFSFGNFLSSRSVLGAGIFPPKNETFRLVFAIFVNWHFSKECSLPVWIFFLERFQFIRFLWLVSTRRFWLKKNNRGKFFCPALRNISSRKRCVSTSFCHPRQLTLFQWRI